MSGWLIVLIVALVIGSLGAGWGFWRRQRAYAHAAVVRAQMELEKVTSRATRFAVEQETLAKAQARQKELLDAKNDTPSVERLLDRLRRYSKRTPQGGPDSGGSGPSS